MRRFYRIFIPPSPDFQIATFLPLSRRRPQKQRHLDVSTLGSLYLREKALEEEYPGIGFRDSIGGREAYVLGHRVAVWEVLDSSRQCGSVSNTADHFQWPPSLVRSALAFAEAFLPEIEKQRFAEIGA